MKAGQLKSGRSGKNLTDWKQAIAIGLSEARKQGIRYRLQRNKRWQGKKYSKRNQQLGKWMNWERTQTGNNRMFSVLFS